MNLWLGEIGNHFLDPLVLPHRSNASLLLDTLINEVLRQLHIMIAATDLVINRQNFLLTGGKSLLNG